jgi:multidrug efflux pump subunit AcrA (membrane-fusion protein)
MTRLAIALLAIAVATGCGQAPSRDTAPPTAARSDAPGSLYQCPMHPQIVRHEPGTCPICGMTLRRVDEAGATDRASAVPGHAPFVLSTERQQLVGVTRAPVAVRALARDVRAAGRIANDPALYQTLVEYREALGARGAIRTSSLHEAHAGADALVDASALRLRRLGIGPRELAALATLDPTTLLLPGKTVWVYAQVFEEDLPSIGVGMHLGVDVPSMPGRRLDATILAIDPSIDPMTRTARVRALVATPDADVRPDTFVVVTIHVALGDQLAIPRSAVLDSGARRLVFVMTDDGRFEPREVQLGTLAGDDYPVLGGVMAGEQVVTSANFLIDSESRFQAAVAAFAPVTAREP